MRHFFGYVILGWFCLLGTVERGIAGSPVYHTDFNNFDPFFSVSGQDGWMTNDIDTGQGFGETNGFGTLRVPVDGSSTAAILGGYLQSSFPPGLHDIFLWKPVNVTGSAMEFSVDFVFVKSSSSGPFSVGDTFGWAVRDANGDEIFKLAFEPTSFTNRLEIVSYDALGMRLSSGLDFFSGSLYTIEISMFPELSGGERVIARLVAAGTSFLLADRFLPTGSISAVEQIAANWKIMDPAVGAEGLPSSYGSNFMMFDNYSVTTFVPNAVFAEDLEVGEAAGSAQVSVVLCDPLTNDLEIDYQVLVETAVEGSDYTLVSPATVPLVIPAGQLIGHIDIPIIDDLGAELEETLIVQLLGTDDPTVSIGSPQMRITIRDDDDLDGDGIPKAWEDMYGLSSRNRNDSLRDLDNDTVSNLVEFALGMNPTVSDLEKMPVLDQSPTSLSLTYKKNPLFTNLDYRVEVSSDMQSWAVVADILVSTNEGIETRQASVPRTERRFLRLVIDVLGN